MSYNKFTVTLALFVALTSGLMSSARAAEKFKTLHRFKFASRNGSDPLASLIFDSAGNLYGTTLLGGVHGDGTVFKLTPNGDGSWKHTVLHSFNRADGLGPHGGLISDSAGNLYGAADKVFKLTPNGDGTWKESVLHSFNGPNGSDPSGLVFDSAGNLYGTTVLGGISTCENGCGLVFELTPDGDGSWKEKVLHRFNHQGNDGYQPEAGLIFDSAGNLYGTTLAGGHNNAGIVFELSPNGNGSWKESVLHSFSFNGNDGWHPSAALILDSAGNLYGTTVEGGRGDGTVFRLTPNGDGSWKESVLHSFNPYSKGGWQPYAALILDSSGNLYGTTRLGGVGWGTVFKLMPNGNGNWKESVLHYFKNTPGANPLSGLISDGNGNLYGTTFGDENNTFGSVFEIIP